MPKISLDNLERYDGHLKDWCDARFAERKVHENWHEAGPSGAVSFYPVPNRPIDPVVNFAFTETLPSGTKGPDNPSTITGVSSVKVTRCGKNLAELNRVYALPNRGITVSVNTDGSIHAAGTVGSITAMVDIGNHDDSANKQLPYWMEVGKTYTLSFSSSNANGNPRAVMYLPNSTTAWGSPYSVYSGESYTFTVDSSRKRALIRISFDANSTVNCDCYIQIEEGSSATSFDGTIPDVYTLSLGSTYYGGTLDVASGVMMVTVVSETVSSLREFSDVYSDYVRFRFSTIYYPKREEALEYFASNMYVIEYSSSWYEHISPNTSGAVSCAITILKSRLDVSGAVDPSNPTAAEWLAAGRAYFSSHPFQFVHKVTSPQTVQLSPTSISSLAQVDKYTPRLNTVYSDQQSVLVRYPKSPIVTGSELDDAILSLGGD